jgi:hypothetical protein
MPVRRWINPRTNWWNGCVRGSCGTTG